MSKFDAISAKALIETPSRRAVSMAVIAHMYLQIDIDVSRTVRNRTAKARQLPTRPRIHTLGVITQLIINEIVTNRSSDIIVLVITVLLVMLVAFCDIVVIMYC